MAAAEEKSEAPAPAPAAASPGKGNSLVLILTAVNSVVTLAMIGILLVNFQKSGKNPRVEDISAQSEKKAKEGKEGKEAAKEGESKDAAAKQAAEFGKMVTLDQFTVNLSTPGSNAPKFVRVNVSLEVPNDDVENEVNFKMPQVRNVIIDLFNSKRPADLATADGRDYLKEEIKNALNGFLVRGKVQGVYFTNFAFSS